MVRLARYGWKAESSPITYRMAAILPSDFRGRLMVAERKGPLRGLVECERLDAAGGRVGTCDYGLIPPTSCWASSRNGPDNPLANAASSCFFPSAALSNSSQVFPR
jgi:hypothetical protein